MSEPPLNDPSHRAESFPSDATDALIPVAPPPERKRGFTRWLSLGWTFLFRLAVLTGGIGLAWLIGAMAAQLLPGPQPRTPPFQEITQRRVNRLVYKVRQLPRWWSEDRSQTPTIAATPPSSEAPPVAAETTPENPAVAKLSEAERDVVKSELSALETEFSALDNRLADLEIKLGEPVSDAPLEARLQRLNRTLISRASTATATAPSTPSTQAASTPSQLAGEAGGATESGVSSNPLFQLAQDRVTLPSSLLFAPEQSLLTPNAERILDTILPDLSRYPGATIVVGSYSDGSQPPSFYQDLTFKQALAVQQYLASRLDEGYRWIPVGYGQTRPLIEGNAPSTQQRNQRIEIEIVPRG